MSEPSRDFLNKLTFPHTPERFRELFVLLRSVHASSRVYAVHFTGTPENQISVRLVNAVQQNFVDRHRKALVALIDKLSSAHKMPLLLRTKKKEYLAEFTLYRWFKDATVGDVPSPATIETRDKAFIKYLQKVADEFEGGDPLKPDGVIDDALVRILEDLKRLSVDQLVKGAERVGVIFGMNDASDEIEMLLQMLRNARKDFGDSTKIKSAMDVICEEVRIHTRRTWRTVWKRRPHELAKVCEMVLTMDVDLLVLADQKFPLGEPFDDANLRALLQTALSTVDNKKKNTVDLTKRAVVRRLWTALGLPRPENNGSKETENNLHNQGHSK